MSQLGRTDKNIRNMQTDKYILPITGVQHYVDNWDTFVPSLPKGTPITFRRDVRNAYSPVAFEAFVEGRKVGYLSRDYAEEALFLSGEVGHFQAELDHGEWKTLYACVPDPSTQLRRMGLGTQYTPRIRTSALEGLPPLPFLREEEEMELLTIRLNALIDRYIRQERPLDEELRSRLEEWLSQYEHCATLSLCREDHFMYKRLSLLLTEAPLWPDDSYGREWVKAFGERHARIHNHLPQEDRPLQFMQRQLSLLRREVCLPGALLDQYRRSFLFDTTQEERTREAVRIEKWLRQALPWSMYARFYDDPPRLAQNIFYNQLSRAELYKVYAHLLVLEYLRGTLKPVSEQDEEEDPSLTCFAETYGQHIDILKTMLRALKAKKLMCQEWLDDTCHYLALIKQLSAPTPASDAMPQKHSAPKPSPTSSHASSPTSSNALLLKAFWDQVTGIRKGMKYQEVPVNRLLEVIGHLRYLGFVTGTYTDIATCLQQELRFELKNLRNMEKCLKEGFYCADPTNDKYLPTPISRLLTSLFPATQEE